MYKITCPGADCGVMQLISVDDIQLAFTLVEPNRQARSGVLAKSKPLIRTDVPPFSPPLLGTADVRIGVLKYWKGFAVELNSTPFEETSTVTESAFLDAGLTQTASLSDITKPGALTDIPNRQNIMSSGNPEPRTVTFVPPTTSP